MCEDQGDYSQPVGSPRVFPEVGTGVSTDRRVRGSKGRGDRKETSL